MAARFRQFDWSSISIGPPERWPESWRNAVTMMLDSSFPACVALGDELRFFYNDAYIPIGGPTRHPAALGQPVPVVWKEIWDEVIRPRFLHTLRTGEPTGGEDFMFLLERSGYLEETYISFSYTALREDAAESPTGDGRGQPNGIFCPSYETTGRVIAERQLNCLQTLAACTSLAETPAEACRWAVAALDTSLRDLPFTLIYLADMDACALQLAASSGFESIPSAIPTRIDLSRQDRNPAEDPWMLAKVARDHEPAVVESAIVQLIDAHLRHASGPGISPNRAIVLPIRGGEHLAGVLVAGANPLRPLDESQAFHAFIAGQLETAIANARAKVLPAAAVLETPARILVIDDNAELIARLDSQVCRAKLYVAERKARELAEEANRSKDEFLAMVAHELCTPVTAMLGWMETLRGKTLDASVAHVLHMMEHSVNSQRRLLDDLMDASRMVADRFHVQPEYVESLQSLSFAVVASLQPQALTKEILLEFSMTADVGPTQADPHRLQQVLGNLLSNAIAFTPHGGRIQVRGQRDGDWITLTVSDSGRGISPEALPHVFERFWQEQGATPRQRTLGLGLTIAERIVALHGGRITAASEGLGHGATFTVSLPICRRVDSISSGNRSTAMAAQRPQPTAQVSTGVRVLLVEDDEGIAKAFERLLTREGYVVIRAAAVEEGVRAAELQEIDVLVCDLTLADGSGLELLRRIGSHLRRSFADGALPAIATSGGDRDNEVTACLAAGFAIHLPKPFDGPTLIAAIRRVTDHAGAVA